MPIRVPLGRELAKYNSRDISFIERSIGDYPAVLRAFNANLDIWATYDVALLTPDGSMKLGGEASWQKTCGVDRPRDVWREDSP